MRAKLLTILWFTITSGSILAQTSSIVGIVKSVAGQPIDLATVGLKHENKGTTSNKDGQFEIKRVKGGSYTLSISFVGFETREISLEVKEGETLNLGGVSLNESAQDRDEVTITGRRDDIEPDPSISR